MTTKQNIIYWGTRVLRAFAVTGVLLVAGGYIGEWLGADTTTELYEFLRGVQSALVNTAVIFAVVFPFFILLNLPSLYKFIVDAKNKRKVWFDTETGDLSYFDEDKFETLEITEE